MGRSVKLDTESLRERQARAQEADRIGSGYCRCWTEPARAHSGHCCMEVVGATCHEEAGKLANAAADPEGRALVQAIHDRKATHEDE